MKELLKGVAIMDKNGQFKAFLIFLYHYFSQLTWKSEYFKKHYYNCFYWMSEEYSPSSFISKFYSILKNKNFERIIRYDEANAKIYIFDKEKLEIQILPYFFRHNKFSSLIRQLNHYGFKKLKVDPVLTFTHPTLQKGEKFLSIVAKKKLTKLQQGNDERSNIIGVSQQIPQPSNYNTINIDQQNIESQDQGFFDGMRINQPNVSTFMAQNMTNFVNPPFFMQNHHYSQFSTYFMPFPQSYQTNGMMGYFQFISSKHDQNLSYS